MLRVFSRAEGRLKSIPAAEGGSLPPDAVWIDLHRPSRDEERLVEAELGLDLPTREEMQEIESSSRLYHENGALFMTATVLCKADTDVPESTAVTFVLAGQRLVTIRHAEPRSFFLFGAHAERQPALAGSGQMVLAGLLDAIIDRTADILERVGSDVDAISKLIFRRHGPEQLPTQDFEAVLRRIGYNQDLTSKARDSLVSLSRLLSFLMLPGDVKSDKALRAQIKSLSRDTLSLTDHATFIANNINFLLDASLGMINNQQNAIVKIFSVAAVILMPPTLVASLYGMNFRHMPELSWQYGYLWALGLMVVSAVLPYLWFKRKGWL